MLKPGKEMITANARTMSLFIGSPFIGCTLTTEHQDTEIGGERFSVSLCLCGEICPIKSLSVHAEVELVRHRLAAVENLATHAHLRRPGAGERRADHHECRRD